MADFHTHVTVSSVLGCGYSIAGMAAGMPPSTALVAGGLCGVAGMLPDVDSDSGIPRREAMGFAAAIVPMLLVDRFRQMGLSHDQMVFAAAVLYFVIRFAAARLIGKWSVHRGMWHSIPAVLIFAGLAFLIAGPADNLPVRYYKALAVGLGSLSHLLLDEFYSIDTRGVVPKFKKSFGTAVKLWGKSASANFSTYAKLAVVAAAILAEPSVIARIEVRNPEFADRLRGYSDKFNRLSPGANGESAAASAPTAQAAPSAPGPPYPVQASPAPPSPVGQTPTQTQPPYGAPPAIYGPEQPSPYSPPPWPPAPQSAPAGNPAHPFSAQAPSPPPAIRRQ